MTEDEMQKEFSYICNQHKQEILSLTEQRESWRLRYNEILQVLTKQLMLETPAITVPYEQILKIQYPWISCSTKLPEPNKRYLTYSENMKYVNHPEIIEELRIDVLYFDGKEWWDDECICYDVLYWIPLPDIPKEDELWIGFH